MDPINAQSKGGTGSRFGKAVIIVAGVAALAACVLTLISVWLQVKNYRKPLLQRYVVRILCLVPIFSAASWASLVSLKASSWIDPFRDVYEAFTIYAFFQLLINFIGGERSLIIMMHGRPPVSHPWPLNQCLAKVDISDPHTFLSIKRGILQYTWIKPLLAIATIIMKATNTYKEGYTGLDSGYFWSGLIYNISISVSLYALAMFWVCMSTDLKPFRPMPKFLCIKGIIFASYWQGFGLSILVWLGAIPDVGEYTPQNLAAAIQDALICFEMPIFAVLHWYAFAWQDYADVTISAARMPVKYALRDAFGSRDLIEDAKETFRGNQYEYRYFDAGDDVLAHEDSAQRVARMMEGMRFERNGKGKYWLPSQRRTDSKTPLLAEADGVSSSSRAASKNRKSNGLEYGTTSEGLASPSLSSDDELTYSQARALEFGDWNYPVIEAHRPKLHDRLKKEPRIITASTNRNVFQPTKENKQRRKSKVKELQTEAGVGKRRSDSTSEASDGGQHNSSDRLESDSDQLVDLVVEDEEAEDIERIRARKEGSPEWNKAEPKHFVHTYPEPGQGEDVRAGFEPRNPVTNKARNQHKVDAPFENSDSDPEMAAEAREWQRKDYSDEEQSTSQINAPEDEANVWNSPKR